MPRSRRVVVAGFPHHVILRGNNRRRLFSFRKDYLFFLRLMLVSSLRHECSVSVWCQMTNHVHMVITPATPLALAAFVKRLAQCFAQRRNAARGGSGKLFEERYKSKCIVTDVKLAATTAYIELNPVRAGMVDGPLDYAWSSCALHLGRPASPLLTSIWVPSPWYESLGRDHAARADAYREFLMAYPGRVDRDALPALQDPPAPVGAHRVLRPDGSSAR